MGEAGGDSPVGANLVFARLSCSPIVGGRGDENLRHVLVGVIRIYQRYISRWTPSVCRFRPTCSEYAAQALLRHGTVRGVGMTLKRLCRCHPFHPGGYDPVK